MSISFAAPRLPGGMPLKVVRFKPFSQKILFRGVSEIFSWLPPGLHALIFASHKKLRHKPDLVVFARNWSYLLGSRLEGAGLPPLRERLHGFPKWALVCTNLRLPCICGTSIYFYIRTKADPPGRFSVFVRDGAPR